MPIINQNIKVLRKQMGLTQEKFAELLGIKRSLIGAYEEARAIPPAENLNKLSTLFNVSLDQLLNYSFEKDTVKKETFLASKEFSRNISESVHKEISNQIQDSHVYLKPQNRVSTPDLFSKITSPSNSYVRTKGIPYIAQEEKFNFFQNSQDKAYIEQLPFLTLPFLEGNDLLAFDAPRDFPLANSIIIAERVRDWQLIKDGENHLIFTSRNEILYRRVYNQLDLKGVILTSSDKEGILSQEFKKSDLKDILFAKMYFSKNMPLPIISLTELKNKVSELNEEISFLIDRQSTK